LQQIPGGVGSKPLRSVAGCVNSGGRASGGRSDL
jgi:hypothetical protein